MTGEQRIAAPRERVWLALNDPAVLARCIPGCQTLERESPERMKATVEIRIGPIGARFAGAVTLSDLDPPAGYTITGEGQGGVVGFARGGARVRLDEDGAGTRLSYEVDAEVGGRLAQLGGPIIDATAKQLAGRFFDGFGRLVEDEQSAARAVEAQAGAAPAMSAAIGEPPSAAAIGERPSAEAIGEPPSAAARAPARAGGSPVAWALAVVVALLAGLLVGRSGAAAASDWAGLAIGLVVVVVAAAAFESGRRAATPVLTLDAALLRRLLDDGR